MAREDLHFRLRIPEELKSRVEAAAAANRRSMTAEIVSTLEDAYPPDRTIDDTIYFARQILDEYNDVKSFARLRELRDMLEELVQQFESIRSVQNDDEDRDPRG